MSREPAVRRDRAARLTRSLERRLLSLTSGLDHADVSEKGIDVVKEIRELHALLRSLHENETDSAPPPLEVRWLDAPPEAVPPAPEPPPGPVS